MTRPPPSKTQAAALSIASGAGLTLAKLVVGLATGSLSILSEALHSLLDFIAAVITFFVVRLSGQPADANHPYGHARAEQLGALAETVLLSITATLVMTEAYRRLFIRPEIPEVGIWSFVVMGGSIVVDLIRVRALRAAARVHKSAALEADAANFSNDLLSSTLVLIALTIIVLAPSLPFVPPSVTSRVDAVAAAIVALLAFRVALTLAWRAVNNLMDAVPRELSVQLLALVEAVPGVLPGTARVRSRLVGEIPYVDVTVNTDHAASLAEAHILSRHVEEAVKAEHPEADVVVEVRPGRSEYEAQTRTVRAVAARLGLDVHHVDVLLVAGGIQVDVDLELSPALTLAEAHRQSEALETEMVQMLPEVRRVAVHLEPRHDHPRPAVRHEETARAVRLALQEQLAVDRIVEVEAALTEEGAVVNVRVLFAPELTLAAVHAEMSTLERQIRVQVPGVDQVRIDPEPAEPVPGTSQVVVR
ncbi:cation diffusion facilitator family transporter [Deinococcus metallilatus]|uniref:Cation diffusion facilitator family transporter n=1 Tax=Deinococcus metallilatus TaxID=1211322 RepID=A0AAJ5F137_9DEIO|nr:cation diffusion facilitator family transporter [Deinococcus metallilatus]MBB5297429.1 cation diffusion facilitator family transporter [Deinococcus metallilatus]RXJ08069.1 cation transporter [Deinococcus metallilatus]TLK20835.1 cation-efflux pump [Deinococcus metallilatus]GMA17009.1 cation transporter [Deinococcus metallilatus]